MHDHRRDQSYVLNHFRIQLRNHVNPYECRHAGSALMPIDADCEQSRWTSKGITWHTLFPYFYLRLHVCIIDGARQLLVLFQDKQICWEILSHISHMRDSTIVRPVQRSWSLRIRVSMPQFSRRAYILLSRFREYNKIANTRPRFQCCSTAVAVAAAAAAAAATSSRLSLHPASKNRTEGARLPLLS